MGASRSLQTTRDKSQKDVTSASTGRLIGCVKTMAQPMMLMLILVAAQINNASSDGSQENGQAAPRTSNPLDQLFSEVLLATASSEDSGNELPCRSGIPRSAYASTLLPRRRIHVAGEACPSEYVMTTDANRNPAQIPEAKCKCILCQIPRFSGSRRYKCMPIYHTVPVMRRESQDSQWNLALERISVGCSCQETRRCS